MLVVGIVAILGSAQTVPAYAVRPLHGVTIQGLPPVTGHICVDQFGYLPQGDKVAVISDPQRGYNSGDHYACGARLQLRSRAGNTVFTGPTTAWKDGATDEDSGDRGWWFDFSDVEKAGEYYVFDPS